MMLPKLPDKRLQERGTADMPNPKKKQRLVGPAASGMAARAVPLRRSRRINGKPEGTIAQADVVVEHIFGYLPPEDIMRSRRVCKRWKDAAKNTIVPIPTKDSKSTQF